MLEPAPPAARVAPHAILTDVALNGSSLSRSASGPLLGRVARPSRALGQSFSFWGDLEAHGAGGSGVDRVDVKLGAVHADALARASNLGHPVATVAPSYFDAALVLRDEHVLFE